MKGLVGKKIGMTQIFCKEGFVLPVTVIEIKKNYIVQIKNEKNDKYTAIQLTTGLKKDNQVKKSELGHFNKANVKIGIGLWEFRVEKIEKFSLGDSFSVEFFDNIKKVDVTGLSKGKGFSGTVKRWNFKTQDASHGNSLSHRAPGSIGQNQTPGRVFKGKKMSGQLGNERKTIQNVDVIKIEKEKNLLLLKGSVPGNNGNYLMIKFPIKNKIRNKIWK